MAALTSPTHLTCAQAAATYGTSPATWLRLCHAGYLPGAYRTAGGHWRIPRASVLEHLRGPLLETPCPT